MSATLQVVKLTSATNHFNKHQKVWIISRAGTLDCRVVGRYRGRGRYVCAWIHEKDYDPARIVDCEVTQEFHDRILSVET